MKRVTKRIKPNFLVIGAAKCGTTSLCDLLGQHPQLFMSTPKELYFFCRRFEEKSWEWYESFFAGAKSSQTIGEGTPFYTDRVGYPKTAERIAKSLPQVKLIYIVRPPLERIVSLWRMWANMKQNVPEFNQSVQDESLQPELVYGSKYWFQISAYRDYFPDDQILVLFLEDFKSNTEAVMERCFKFLGVDPTVQLFEAERPRNYGDLRHPDRYLTSLILRKMPGVMKVYHHLPERLRARIRSSHLIKRKEKIDIPEWDLSTRKWVIDQLAEDSRMFLENYGKPTDYWSFN